MTFARIAAAPVAIALALVMAGCASSGGTPAPSTTPAPQLSGTVTVLAAASLTDTFADIATAFEAENPGVTVQLSFGGSSALAQQIIQGSPADVFAAANDATMDLVADAHQTSADLTLFATNTLEIAVPVGNPGGVTGLSDFADESLTIALCAPEVPCGAAAKQVFANADITPAPDTYEQDVKAVLTKVELGEVDAGMVYKTDVVAAGDKVDGIEFPESSSVVNNYPITTLKSSANAASAQAFVAFVTSSKGLAILAKAGFGAP